MPHIIEMPDDEPDIEFSDPQPSRSSFFHFPEETWHAPLSIPTVPRIRATESAAMMRASTLLDSKKSNWPAWSRSMTLLFKLVKVNGYVYGTVECPNADDDPIGADNWEYNDTYAQIMIDVNVSDNEKMHTSGAASSHRMWLNLQSMHEYTNRLVLTAHLRTLWSITADEGTDICDHLGKLKRQWDQSNVFTDFNYQISEMLFKCIIASSLPPSWDTFTDPYVVGQIGEVTSDPKKLLDSQQFLGIIRQEAERRQMRRQNGAITYPEQAQKSSSQPLSNRITGGSKDTPKKKNKKKCKQCQREGHNTNKCRFLGKPKCLACGKFGHESAKCWGSNETKCPIEGEKDENSKKRQKISANTAGADPGVEANDAEEGEPLAMNLCENCGDQDADRIISVESHSNDVIGTMSFESDPSRMYDDWIPDSGTTSHITRRRDAFTKYSPIREISISIPGGQKTSAVGRGDLNLRSECDGNVYVLELRNVLYVATHY